MKKSKKQKNIAKSAPTKNIALELRLREGSFIVLSIASIFFLVALMTYNNGDPGWSTTGENAEIVNSAGKVGSWLADVLLYFFGYISYLFPVMIAYSGILIFYKRREHISFGLWSIKIIGFLLVIIGGCGLANFYLNTLPNFMPGSAGGILGQLLHEELVISLNHIGSTLVLLASFLTGVTLVTGLSWSAIFKKITLSLFNYSYNIYNKIKTYRISKEKFITPIMQSIKCKQKVNIPKIQPIIKLPPVKQEKPIKVIGTHLPPITILNKTTPGQTTEQFSNISLDTLSKEVEAKLLDFGIAVRVESVHPGPVITRFEMQLAPGIKASKITALSKDLARSLSVRSVRVVEVIPGKTVVGLEIPNQHREIVYLGDLIESKAYQNADHQLMLALGKDIAGTPVIVNLAKMPHLLVAGTTGSGKSVSINAMLLSMLYKTTPAELRLILIDPKMLELSIYEGIPHLLTPVVTDMKDAANVLSWCVAEMERRYQLMSALGVRNLEGYNNKVTKAITNGNPIIDPLWQPIEGEETPILEKLPFIVIIIDEFADMIMVVGKKVEELIARIAQKARASGIHLLLATQRPSVDVITGLIKANIPTRIAFQVSSKIDSRTILDQQGAEQLLGDGDMLYLPPGSGIPIRIHGAFVSDDEVHAVVKALKETGQKPEYINDLEIKSSLFGGLNDSFDNDGEQDPLYDEAIFVVTKSRKASISNLQRRLKIGYNRAARLIEDMESAGVVSAMQSNGGREVLAPPPVEQD